MSYQLNISIAAKRFSYPIVIGQNPDWIALLQQVKPALIAIVTNSNMRF